MTEQVFSDDLKKNNIEKPKRVEFYTSANLDVSPFLSLRQLNTTKQRQLLEQRFKSKTVADDRK